MRAAHPHRPTLVLLAVGALVGLSGVPAHAEGDAKLGAAVFATHCVECHSVKEGKDKKGPSLFGIVGRKAGAAPGFVYSDAMRQSGLTWDAATLDRYVAAPSQAVPGGKMKYDGLPAAADRAHLVQYLASVSAPH